MKYSDIYTICFSVVLQLIPLRTIADYISEVDLRKPGFSMHNIPVMDQTSYELCYAYAASAMIDSYINSKLTHSNIPPNTPPHRTSPIALAFTAYYNKNITDLFVTNPLDGGGFICDAVRSVKKYGSCNDKLYENIPKWRIEDLLMKYQDFKKLSDKLKIVLEYNQINPNYLSDLKDELNTLYLEILSDSLFHDKFKNQQNLKLTDIQKFKSPFDFLMKTLFDDCDSKQSVIQFEIPSCITTNFPGKNIAIQMINENLNKDNPLPVGIGYCSTVLKQGRSYNDNAFFSAIKEIYIQGSCQPHASLIIGRRNVSKGPDSSKIQFLIRNSSGNTCDSYSTDWDCDYRGDIWIDADVLGKSIKSIEFLSSQ